MTLYLVGSFVSDRISSSSSLDRKKKRGKKSLFFSKYLFKPFRISSRNSLLFLSFSNILSMATTARTCLSYIKKGNGLQTQGYVQIFVYTIICLIGQDLTDILKAVFRHKSGSPLMPFICQRMLCLHVLATHLKTITCTR